MSEDVKDLIVVDSETAAAEVRYRAFAGVLYCNDEFIQDVCHSHVDFRRAQWIEHRYDKIEQDGVILDCDPDSGELYKCPHIHIVIRTGDAHTVSAIRTWFSGFVDSTGKETSVLFQPIRSNSESGSLRYLIHADHPNKFQYSPRDVRFLGSKAKEVFYDSIRDLKWEYDPFAIMCTGLASNKLRYSDILHDPALSAVYRDKAYAVKSMVKNLRDEQSGDLLLQYSDEDMITYKEEI